LTANTTPETHRGQSISYFFLSMNIAQASAPSFGMLLINLNPAWLFILTETLKS
jgi:hypothetical protein